MTRASLEARAAALLPHLSLPIQSALDSASLSLSDIESVILVGGSSRVPLVQHAVAQAVGADKIAKNVNADEAGVLGAALYGAGSVPGFRTKDIRVVDVTPFAVDVAYEADKGSAGASHRSTLSRRCSSLLRAGADEPGLHHSCRGGDATDGEPRIITTHLFPPHTKLPSRKTLTLRRTSDLSLDLSYPASSLPAAPSGHLSTVHLRGISAACANLTADHLANATVQVPLELDANGLVKVGKAVLVLREEDEADKAAAAKGAADKNGVADKLKGLFSRFKAGKNDTAAGASDGASEGEGEADAESGEPPLSDEDRAELDRLLAEAARPPARVALESEVVQPEQGGRSMAREDLVEAKKRCASHHPFLLATSSRT